MAFLSKIRFIILAVFVLLFSVSCSKKSDPILGPTPATFMQCYQVDNSNFPENRAFLYTGTIDHAIGNFSMSEEGRPIIVNQVKPVNNTEDPLYAAILIDVSDTVSTTVMTTDIIPAVKNYINSMTSNDYLEIITAGYNPANWGNYDVYQSFTNDKTVLNNQVDLINVRSVLGSTDYTSNYDAIGKAIEDISTKRGRKIIFLITDGTDNASTKETEITVVDKANGYGIPITIIGFGTTIDGTTDSHNYVGVWTRGYYYFTASSTVSVVLQTIKGYLDQMVQLSFRSRVGSTSNAYNSRVINIYYNADTIPSSNRYCVKYFGFYYFKN